MASHATALALWDLVEHPPGPVHVTVDPAELPRHAGVVVHRSACVRRTAPRDARSHLGRALRRRPWGDLVRCAPRRAAPPSVPFAGGSARLGSSRTSWRATTARRSRGAVDARRLLADGCQSELEIWGCLQVLARPACRRSCSSGAVTVGSDVLPRAAYDEPAGGRDGRRRLARLPPAARAGIAAMARRRRLADAAIARIELGLVPADRRTLRRHLWLRGAEVIAAGVWPRRGMVMPGRRVGPTVLACRVPDKDLQDRARRLRSSDHARRRRSAPADGAAETSSAARTGRSSSRVVRERLATAIDVPENRVRRARAFRSCRTSARASAPAPT